MKISKTILIITLITKTLLFKTIPQNELFKTINLEKKENFKINKQIEKFRIPLNLNKSQKLLDIKQSIINENLMHCDNFKIFASIEKNKVFTNKKNFHFLDYDKKNQFLAIFSNTIELFSILKKDDKSLKIEKFNDFLEDEIKESLFLKKENYFFFEIFQDSNLGVFIWNNLIIIKNVLTGKTHFSIKGEFLISKKNKVILFSNFGGQNLGIGIYEKKRNKIFIYKLDKKNGKSYIIQIIDLEMLEDFSKKNEINIISVFKQKMKINIIYVLIQNTGLFKFKEIFENGKFLYHKNNFQYIKGSNILEINKKVLILENMEDKTNLKIYNFYDENSNLFM